MHTPLPPRVSRAASVARELESWIHAGARPPGDKKTASSIVYIIKDDVVRRTLSVSAQNKPNEYEITYNVRFSVSSGDKELLAPQDISATRSYSFDETRLLAKEHEEAILRQAMAHDLADRVIRQLSSL